MFDGWTDLTVEMPAVKLDESIGKIDAIESFGAKFSRLQDTITDKLLPLFLKQPGENPLDIRIRKKQPIKIVQ